MNTQVWLMILVTCVVVLLAMYAIVTAGYRYRSVSLVQVIGPTARYWYRCGSVSLVQVSGTTAG